MWYRDCKGRISRKAKNLTSGANSLRDGASVRLLAGRHINLVIGLREHVS